MSSLLIAVDAPRNPQIVPRQSTYKPGDRIHCSAEGNPAPSYQWTDLVSETVIQGPVLVISEDMVNDYHAFQCTATNQYNSVSSTLTFTAEGMKPLIARSHMTIGMTTGWQTYANYLAAHWLTVAMELYQWS